VGCKHHLLLEVAAPPAAIGGPATHPGLLLNAPLTASPGRRAHLKSSSHEVAVEVWMARAVNRLARMVDSCALDVADRGVQPAHVVQRLLGLRSKNSLVRETSMAKAKLDGEQRRVLVEYMMLMRVGRGAR
jgi:hypothetical protein